MLGAHVARNTMAVATGKTALSRTAFLVKPNIVFQAVVRRAPISARNNFERRAAQNKTAPAGERGNLQ